MSGNSIRVDYSINTIFIQSYGQNLNVLNVYGVLKFTLQLLITRVNVA